jgi:hypothetical protein
MFNVVTQLLNVLLVERKYVVENVFLKPDLQIISSLNIFQSKDISIHV